MELSNKITLIISCALVIIILAVFVYLLLENSRMKDVIINKTLLQMEEDYKSLEERESREFTAMENSIMDALSALGAVSSYDKKVQTAYNSILEIIKESTFAYSNSIFEYKYYELRLPSKLCSGNFTFERI